MRSTQGEESGLVPINYIDKFEEEEEGKQDVSEGEGRGGDTRGKETAKVVKVNGEAEGKEAENPETVSWYTCMCMYACTHAYVRVYIYIFCVYMCVCVLACLHVHACVCACKCNSLPLSQALREVLRSIENAIQQIHDSATNQGGKYTPQQLSNLQ